MEIPEPKVVAAEPEAAIVEPEAAVEEPAVEAATEEHHEEAVEAAEVPETSNNDEDFDEKHDHKN